MKQLLTCTLALFSFISYSQTLCEDGFAGNYDCKGLDLQSRISAPDLGAEEHEGFWVNDIWGWYDSETGKEYALVGMTNGTSFVDVTDPVNPIVLGVLPEHNSIADDAERVAHDGAKSVWRDIKVYNEHAYIVSEDDNHGIQVFSLKSLRNVTNPSRDNLFEESGHYDGLGQAHNININEETGYLYAVGFDQDGDFNCNGGGLHIVNLSDPTNPSFAGCFDDDGYTHDTQCVVYRGPDTDYQGMEICFNSNEEDVVIVNVEDKGNVTMISKNPYDGAEYVHQGWLTEDHRYFLSNDELDEARLEQNTRTFIWDVQDLDNPVLLGYHEHENQAIDHNLYVDGAYVFASNYTNGLRVLDTVGIEGGALREIAHFDTFVSSDATSFRGTWSNYPFLPSGNFLISDITNGLFIVSFNDFFISVEPEDITACVGDHVNIPMEVFGEDATFQWQINTGSGFEDITDFERYINTTTSTMHAHTLTLEQSGYQFRCIVSNGEQEHVSEEMTLSVIELPQSVAAFEAEEGEDVGEYTFTNNSTFSDSYQWDFGDGTVSTEMSPTHVYESSDLYEVELVAMNDCSSDTTRTMLRIVVSAAEYSQVSVYPTIAYREITIQNGVAQPFTYALRSLSGNLILQGAARSDKATIPIDMLQSGVYLLQVFTNDQVVTRKVIVR